MDNEMDRRADRYRETERQRNREIADLRSSECVSTCMPFIIFLPLKHIFEHENIVCDDWDDEERRGHRLFRRVRVVVQFSRRRLNLALKQSKKRENEDTNVLPSMVEILLPLCAHRTECFQRYHFSWWIQLFICFICFFLSVWILTIRNEPWDWALLLCYRVHNW